ncbi:MAG: hypothetical protein KDJ36_04110 [Hyphomicrobiaceae bacterium]|nr:hypothetical protein [Hyphomicrobiaceae bacterium]
MTSSATADNAAMYTPRPLTVQGITIALVWLAVASGAIVFTEPAPVDALTLGLILALPIAGLLAARQMLNGILAVGLVLAACALLAVLQSEDVRTSTIHSLISLYLYTACFVFASFIAQRPGPRTHLILHAYLWAAFIAAAAGIIGYLNLLPGAGELFTKYGRASGTFKDPNVFGAFLVPAVVYALHLVVTRSLTRTLLPGIMMLVLTFATLLSYSRGAWVNLAIAAATYGYLSFITAQTNLYRLKLLSIAGFGLVVLIGALIAALQVPEIADQLIERASLTQSYDEGPEGRFGGQLKAIGLILQHPFGIGALQFGGRHHFEDVHNVYLNMFLNAGWLGGFMFIAAVAITLVCGFSHLLRRTATQPLFMVAYAAFLGVALEGLLVDIDHWRHVYLLLAVIWGLMASDRMALVSGLTSDRGPCLLPEVTLLAPQREARITGPASRRLPRIMPAPRRLQPQPRPRRPSRIDYR